MIVSLGNSKIVVLLHVFVLRVLMPNPLYMSFLRVHLNISLHRFITGISSTMGISSTLSHLFGLKHFYMSYIEKLTVGGRDYWYSCRMLYIICRILLEHTTAERNTQFR